ncbi:MAG: ABC transporter permease [Deltaproteobacteria bacterium]|nr:ABC transporter permease [Deltaproteobacteria bacterium]
MDFSLLIDLGQSALRMSTPLLLGGLGCLFAQWAGVWDIGIEGKMLFGCFFGILVSHFSQSAWLGVAGAVTAGLLLGLLMAVFIVSFKADQIIVGVAVNIFSFGLTTFLLLTILGVKGSFGPDGVVSLPLIESSAPKGIPILYPLLFGYSPLVYLAWVLVILSSVLLYRTSFGLGLRAVGEHPQTAEAAGISVSRKQYWGLAIAGGLSGLAGAQLTLGFLPIFSENMTAGRGFIAFSAVILGAGHPVKVFLAALMFGMTEALGMALQSANMPVHFPLMVPYVVTIFVLVLFQLRRRAVGKGSRS